MDDPAFSLWEEGGTVLGEGQFGSERWELVFFSDSEAPPKNPEDHSGPGLVSLRYAPADGSHGVEDVEAVHQSDCRVDSWKSRACTTARHL
jgi:hypothetical protein